MNKEKYDAMKFALDMFVVAKNLPSVGDVIAIPYEKPKCTFHKEYGGGDCAKHGRYYGSYCCSCDEEWQQLVKQTNQDAIHMRDNSLRIACDLACKALAMED